MYTIFLFINLVLVVISCFVFKKWINPVSFYSFIWLVIVTGFEVKLLQYNPLSYITWLVIISFQLSFSTGCIMGFKTSIKETKPLKISEADFCCAVNSRISLKKAILVLSLISSIGIIPNLYNLIAKYGTNILASSALIYHDRLTGGRGFELIPYFGAISHVAVIFSGIYISKHGFKLFSIIPISLLIANILPTGGRMDLLYGILYIIIPVALGKKKLQFKLSQKIFITAIFLVLIGIILTISNVRSIQKAPPMYMSHTMEKLYEKSPVIPSIYLYLTAPIGVLNKYLEEPDYSFGGNSFGIFYSILNKFGVEIEYTRYQKALPIPMYVNVGSYIREIIQDFTYIGILIVFMWAGIFGIFFKKFQTKESLTANTFVVIFFISTFMSFYMWSFREPAFWIICFVGLITSQILDKRYLLPFKNRIRQ